MLSANGQQRLTRQTLFEPPKLSVLRRVVVIKSDKTTG